MHDDSGPYNIHALLMQVESVEEAWQTLQKGAEARHSAETKMNDRSSRSHCMLCVKVRGQSKITGLTHGSLFCDCEPLRNIWLHLIYCDARVC